MPARLLSILMLISSIASLIPSARAQETPGSSEELPAYLRPESDATTLDLIAGEELSPLQRVAREMASKAEHREVTSLRDIQNLLTFEYTIQGATEEEIVHEARLRALKAAAGRIYMADYILLGRDLLEAYLGKNAERFIARTTLLDRRILGEDDMTMTIRVSVNLDLFYHDLDMKRFIAKPELKPITAVFLKETVNGVDDTSAGGRNRIEQTLQKNLYRVVSDKIREPTLDTDPTVSQDLLREARFEAQRNNVEIIYVGSLEINEIEGKQVLFDDYFFYEAEISLKMVRVDNNEVVMEIDDRYSASGYNVQEAISNVLDMLVPRATQTLTDDLNATWSNRMFARGQYRLMFDELNAEQVKIVHNWISEALPEIEIYQRAFYGGVLVLNVMVPSDKREQLRNYMSESRVPQFNIRQIDKNRFVLAML